MISWRKTSPPTASVSTASSRRSPRWARAGPRREVVAGPGGILETAAPGTMPVGAAAWQGTEVRWPEGLGTQQRRGFDVLSHQENTVGPGSLPLERLFVHVPAAVVLVRTPGSEAATITATL